MSRFPVELTDDAEQSLADLWVRAADRAAVTAAEAEIHRLLSSDPLRHGFPLAEGLRKLTVPPLTVFYSVQSAPPSVEISQVAIAPS